MSFLAVVMRCIARNHLVSGVFDLWKIVPDFADVCTRQAEHWKMRRVVRIAVLRAAAVGAHEARPASAS